MKKISHLTLTVMQGSWGLNSRIHEDTRGNNHNIHVYMYMLGYDDTACEGTKPTRIEDDNSSDVCRGIFIPPHQMQ